MEGIDLSRYQAHPVVLRDHDMTQPVAMASNLKVTPQKITACVTFAPDGASQKADETRALVKSGFLTGISAAIIPLESQPIDSRNPRGGQRITKSILVEFSVVSVPSDAASGVTGRGLIERTGLANPVRLRTPSAALEISARRRRAVSPPIGGLFERAQ